MSIEIPEDTLKQWCEDFKKECRDDSLIKAREGKTTFKNFKEASKL